MVVFRAFQLKMLYKISLPFLLLSCFSSTGFASPSIDRSITIEENSLTENNGESFKELPKEIEKSFKRPDNSVSIIQSGIEEGLETAATWVNEHVLRMELFMMADGSHYLFPNSGKQEIESKYKAFSMVVSKLLMNLKTMERTEKVIKNVTKNFISTITPHVNEDQKSFSENILLEYCEALEHHMSLDGVLRNEYYNEAIKALETVKRDPEMREPFVKVWEKNSDSRYPIAEKELINFFEDKKTFRRAIANKMFLKSSVKHLMMIYSSTQYERYLLARALIQKAVASQSSESKVNDVYQRTLVKAGEALTQGRALLESKLFEFLHEELNSNPALYEEVQALVKEIKKNTAYDINMLWVDYALL